MKELIKTIDDFLNDPDEWMHWEILQDMKQYEIESKDPIHNMYVYASCFNNPAFKSNKMKMLRSYEVSRKEALQKYEVEYK